MNSQHDNARWWRFALRDLLLLLTGTAILLAFIRLDPIVCTICFVTAWLLLRLLGWLVLTVSR